MSGRDSECGLPRRGNLLMRGLGHGLMRLFGWRVEGALPEVPRCVAIAAPHTSNWDFFFGICTVFALGVRVDWIGKHTLFRPPFGRFMRWLGGTPVTRVSGEGAVPQIVEKLAAREQFIFGLSPEGTRKRVERWRTGFYHVALQTGAPIVLTYFDYAHRRVGIGPLFHPTGDLDADLVRIREFYRDKTAKHPQLA